MSGIGFQKLQGQGTTAYDQLQKTAELISEIQKLNYPDIYKQARMFVGQNYELEPVAFSHYFNQNNQLINFNGRYFGYWTICLEQGGTGASNNSYGRASLKVFDGDDVKFRSSRMVHGDDVVSLSNQIDANIIGFGTSAQMGADGSNSYVSATLSFLGFKIGDALPDPVIIVPPVVIPIPQPPESVLKVTVLSSPNALPLSFDFGGSKTLSIPFQTYTLISPNVKVFGFGVGVFSYEFKQDGVLISSSDGIVSVLLDTPINKANELIISYDYYLYNKFKVFADTLLDGSISVNSVDGNFTTNGDAKQLFLKTINASLKYNASNTFATLLAEINPANARNIAIPCNNYGVGVNPASKVITDKIYFFSRLQAGKISILNFTGSAQSFRISAGSSVLDTQDNKTYLWTPDIQDLTYINNTNDIRYTHLFASKSDGSVVNEYIGTVNPGDSLIQYLNLASDVYSLIIR